MSAKALFLLDVLRLTHYFSTFLRHKRPSFPHFPAFSTRNPQVFHLIFAIFPQVIHISLSFSPNYSHFIHILMTFPPIFHIFWWKTPATDVFCFGGPRSAGSKGRPPFYQPQAPLGLFLARSSGALARAFSQNRRGVPGEGR